nr:type III pantothenate kinase [Desulfosarcina cetonica]
MILCLNIGNTNMTGGVFDGPELRLDFRRAAHPRISGDEFGLFLRGVLKSNAIDPQAIRHIAVCSVLPEATYSLNTACRKYFAITPFVIRAGVRTGLKIRYRNPQEVGADRIANAIAAVHQHPDQDLVVAGFGTATTLCAIGADKTYHGGAILPGIRIGLTALVCRAPGWPAWKLPPWIMPWDAPPPKACSRGCTTVRSAWCVRLSAACATKCFGGKRRWWLARENSSACSMPPGFWM